MLPCEMLWSRGGSKATQPPQLQEQQLSRGDSIDNEGVEITSAAGLQSDSKCVARSLKPPKVEKLQQNINMLVPPSM